MTKTKNLARLKPGLKKLELDVGDLATIEGLARVDKLETLTLHGYAMNLAPLARLANLRHLELHLDRGVTGLESLGALVKLRTLVIEESSLVDLRICSGMSELVELRVKGGLKTAQGIGGARRLEKVELIRTQITSLAPLGTLSRLRELSLWFSRKLVDLRGIEKLKELRDLEMFEVRGPIRSLKALEAEVSPAQLAALKRHLPRTKLFVDVEEDTDDCIEVGIVRVHRATAGGEPWVISQDLIDDLGLDDQNDVEEAIAKAFAKAQPKLARKISYDSEGDAFVATSTDRAAMMALAKLIDQRVESGDDDDDDDDDDE